jgi:hypothetical protein
MVLARQMAGQLLTALGVWVGVVALISIAGVVILRDTGYAFTTGLHRFAIVFGNCLLFVLVLDLLLCLLPFSPLGDAPLYAMISKMLAIAFAGAPVFFAVLGAISLANRGNPWEYLPGGPPFALREFARKYPQLRVETLGFGGTTVTVSNGTTGVILDESELGEADMKWKEGCDRGEPERLGGPPPYPGAKCLARLEIRAPDYGAAADDEDDKDDDNDDNYVPPPESCTTKYVYSVGWVSTAKVLEFYRAWAKRLGQDPNIYSTRSPSMEVLADGRTWVISILGTKGGTVHDVYLEYKETQPPAGRPP